MCVIVCCGYGPVDIEPVGHLWSRRTRDLIDVLNGPAILLFIYFFVRSFIPSFILLSFVLFVFLPFFDRFEFCIYL